MFTFKVKENLSLLCKRFKFKNTKYKHENLSNSSFNYEPLVAQYLESEHKEYVSAIEAALDDNNICNIALSGNFGVGKSSILKKVAQIHRKKVVELSMSALAPIKMQKLDDSLPIQATTPTNRIQQEIVKQLLYREDPTKTPGSRFRRIERFRPIREIAIAILFGFVISVVFLLTGWTVNIVDLFPYPHISLIWSQSIVWIVISCIELLGRWLFFGKLHIKQLSAGSASITLDDNSVSYFDQYLDEIFYFFEISKRDIVIFEDIDRFNDSYIFETLRALNSLLNISSQFNKKPIRFIYAIKDSVFENVSYDEEDRRSGEIDNVLNDAITLETERANRTKFFDLIIPVVPFVTHLSARNLIIQQLKDFKNEISLDLIDIAAQYVPDMRLIKNVYNEFYTFNKHIFSGDGEGLNLNKTELFAMMLYKSKYLRDFEMIRLGDSNLDRLYRSSRVFVEKNIKKIEKERRELRDKLNNINGVANRCVDLGEDLIKFITNTVEIAKCHWANENLQFKGKTISRESLNEVGFWEDFICGDDNNSIINLNLSTTSYPRKHCSFYFTRSNVETGLKITFDVQKWNEGDREEISNCIKSKTDEITLLRSADFETLIRQPGFLISVGESERSFDQISLEILNQGLAYQLVKNGYIGRNFTLYTSTFHGNRISSSALNFIIHHVERNQMDVYFELSEDDVDAIIRERGKSSLSDSAMYNISILDYLMAHDKESTDVIVKSLTSYGDKQSQFIQAYLVYGQYSQQLIARLSIFSNNIVSFLVSDAQLENVLKLKLVDEALVHLTTMMQRTDSRISLYLLTHYAEFETLKSDNIDFTLSESIGEFFENSNILIPNLKVLGKDVLISFVSRNLYEINSSNIEIAINDKSNKALDSISEVNDIIYYYMLNNLSLYLKAVDDDTKTIEHNSNFIKVIQDVLEYNVDAVSEIIRRSSSQCIITDISAVSEMAWPSLAKHHRFTTTFNNVMLYIKKNKSSIDEYLSGLLSITNKILEIDSYDEEDKEKLALKIIGANEYLTSPVLRVNLVLSLKLTYCLDVQDISIENGSLFLLLLENNIIADDAISYEYLLSAEWKTREDFICSSKEFITYMTPELVGNDLENILASDKINSTIKKRIIDNAIDYTREANVSGLTELAIYALKNKTELSNDAILRMAQENVSTSQIISLVWPIISSINRDRLFEILQELGGDYPNLTKVGYDKPLIPNNPENIALLSRLQHEGIVGKYKQSEDVIRVYKKYKET
ncbi:hypothetical protein LMG33818_001760 [Halomonadaceae bacterium LMG 33818]|uniref:YobI family P-loop NTPase n=1 Tax=Cernens ardua TaxID=3402176 RepID=UPI003EDBFD70